VTDHKTSTRSRLLSHAMRLFGEQGYAATSVAQIEQAAGLAPGSGSLYKHFRSKEHLLSEGLDLLLASSEGLMTLLAQTHGPPGRSAESLPATLHDKLVAAAEAGLVRMEQDRDLNRLLFRGLDAFPDLMERFRDGELARVHHGVTTMLDQMAAGTDAHEDWAAIAAVLVGATAHYWVLEDLFGTHPSGVGRQRYAAAAARLASAVLQP
jgi:AcrR family transcriptional regulator